MVVQFKVSHTDYGKRLDQVIAGLMPEYSRNILKKWIQEGNVLVNGKISSPKSRLIGGETVRVLEQRSVPHNEFEPQDIALNVVFEDETIMIINKPKDLVVHPGAGNWDGTLANGILGMRPSNSSLPRAGIVHRLDKNTTGLLVVAKTIESQTSLVRQLQNRSIKREYEAIVYGELKKPIEINRPIGRHPKNRKLMDIVPNGKEAITRVCPTEIGVGWSLVKCKLETGRTHQIRVHLKSIGHPIVGDKSYVAARHQKGEIGDLPTIDRQALHAVELELKHPLIGTAISWRAQAPADFSSTLDYLRAYHTR